MCARTTCVTCNKATWAGCNKATWAGCGQHIEEALDGVAEANRCQCQ